MNNRGGQKLGDIVDVVSPQNGPPASWVIVQHTDDVYLGVQVNDLQRGQGDESFTVNTAMNDLPRYTGGVGHEWEPARVGGLQDPTTVPK